MVADYHPDGGILGLIWDGTRAQPSLLTRLFALSRVDGGVARGIVFDCHLRRLLRPASPSVDAGRRARTCVSALCQVRRRCSFACCFGSPVLRGSPHCRGSSVLQLRLFMLLLRQLASRPSPHLSTVGVCLQVHHRRSHVRAHGRRWHEVLYCCADMGQRL